MHDTVFHPFFLKTSHVFESVLLDGINCVEIYFQTSQNLCFFMSIYCLVGNFFHKCTMVPKKCGNIHDLQIMDVGMWPK